MKLAKWGALALLVAVLPGCVTTYVPPPGEPVATLVSTGFGELRMCRDGKLYTPPKNKMLENTFSIPATGRLTLGAHLVSSGYQYVVVCNPYTSFKPEPGQTYFVNSTLTGNGRCGIEIVREDATKPTGLALDTTIGIPVCDLK